jgi:hypothetical protein
MKRLNKESCLLVSLVISSIYPFIWIYKDPVFLTLQIGGEGLQSSATFGVCPQPMFLQWLYDLIVCVD